MPKKIKCPPHRPLLRKDGSPHEYYMMETIIGPYFSSVTCYCCEVCGAFFKLEK